MDICAERSAILKAVTDGDTEFEALILVSDDHSPDFPMPSGATRQFMAEFGEFDIHCVKRDRSCLTLTTRDLLPHSEALTPAKSQFSVMLNESLKKIRKEIKKAATPKASQSARDDVAYERNIMNWDVSDVLTWLDKTTELPQYIHAFREASVNGAVLLNVDENDLKTMGVENTLHKRKVRPVVRFTL